MHDALEELAELSDTLQSDAMTLPRAYRLICRQLEIFRSRKERPGDSEKTHLLLLRWKLANLKQLFWSQYPTEMLLSTGNSFTKPFAIH